VPNKKQTTLYWKNELPHQQNKFLNSTYQLIVVWRVFIDVGVRKHKYLAVAVECNVSLEERMIHVLQNLNGEKKFLLRCFTVFAAKWQNVKKFLRITFTLQFSWCENKNSC